MIDCNKGKYKKANAQNRIYSQSKKGQATQMQINADKSTNFK